jgi:hypothetical protein
VATNLPKKKQKITLYSTPLLFGSISYRLGQSLPSGVMVSKRHENQKETTSFRKAFFAYPESSDFNSLLDTGASPA